METFKGNVKRVAESVVTPRRVARDKRKGSVVQRMEKMFDKEGRLVEERYRRRKHINRITYKYNKRGNCVERDEYSLEHKVFVRYKYKYDRWGNQIEEQGYDSQGQLLHTLSHRYNEKGDELEKRMRHGESIDKMEYRFDAGGRLVEERKQKNGRFDLLRTYRYDEKGNKAEETTMDSNGNRTTQRFAYRYDENGHMLEEQMLDDEGNVTVQYLMQYDDAGRITQRKQLDKDGNFSGSAYLFDKAGNVVENTWFNSTSRSSGRFCYSYDGQGRLTKEELTTGGLKPCWQDLMMGDGTVEHKVRYMPDNERLCYRYRHSYYVEGGQQESWEEHFDENGQVVQRNYRRYDTLGNLLEDTKNEITRIYQYDSVGNWVQRHEMERGETVEIVKRKIEYYP
ncbi:MAG: hypothetical protein SPJ13_08510 [Bacteroidales bacterium]|nr:hypothetical protein [Bacteroidales bacterium]